MVKPGTKRLLDDWRDYSFRKTFAAVPISPSSIPDFNLHYGSVPNQNAPDEVFNSAPQPYGCTNVSTCQLGANQDKRLYNRDFQESITHANAKGGYDVRASIKTSVDHGLLAEGEQFPSQAAKHKRAAFFRVGKNPDFFTGALTALWLTKRTLSIGTPWYTEWSDAGTGNIHTYDPVTETYSLTGGGERTNIAPTPREQDTNKLPWHNSTICGKKTINGVPYLILEPHQGELFGDSGFLYISAEAFNSVMKIWGTCAFTVAEVDPKKIKTVGHVFLKNLYFGLVDNEVAELQRSLVYLGYEIPHAVTIVFGKETKAALAQFQKDKGIADDGSHFGPLTRYALNKELNPAQTLSGAIILFIKTFLPI